MVVTRPLPPWHPGIPAYVDNAFRARIKVRYAVRVHKAVLEEKRRSAAAEHVVIHRFLDDFESEDHAALGDDYASDSEDLFFDCNDDDAPVNNHLNDAAHRVWKVVSLRKGQVDCLSRILFDESSGGKLLYVAPTGSDKSLTLRMVGTFTGGVCLVIVPLLALTADQMFAITKAIQTYASFEAHHMDE